MPSTNAANGSVDQKATKISRAVHRHVPYIDRPVSPAVGAAIRAVRQFEPRLVREDLGQVVVHDDRYRRSAAQAVARYQRAADQGYVMAHYNLARALAEGRGIKRDFRQAVASFETAAHMGNLPAILRLAEFRLAGLAGPKDRVAALALYFVGAGLDSQGAARAQVLLSPHLDLRQMNSARQQARKFRDLMPPIDLILQRRKERNLLDAAARGDLAQVQSLLKAGVDANAINALGRTSVVAAAWRGHAKVVRLLIDAGVEIDAADNQGRTALSWAAINGHPEIVAILTDQAALVDVRDDDGLTPLMRAAWNGHGSIVSALIKAGSDIRAADDRGITALQRAQEQNEQGIVALLLEAGAK